MLIDWYAKCAPGICCRLLFRLSHQIRACVVRLIDWLETGLSHRCHKQPPQPDPDDRQRWLLTLHDVYFFLAVMSHVNWNERSMFSTLCLPCLAAGEWAWQVGHQLWQQTSVFFASCPLPCPALPRSHLLFNLSVNASRWIHFIPFCVFEIIICLLFANRKQKFIVCRQIYCTNVWNENIL